MATVAELEVIVNEQAKTIDTLNKRIEVIESSVNADPGADYSQDVKNINKRLDNLEGKSTTIKPIVKQTAPSETFTVDKKSYKFRVAYINDGGDKVYTKDLLKDKERLAEIVKNNPYWVTEVK